MNSAISPPAAPVDAGGNAPGAAPAPRAASSSRPAAFSPVRGIFLKEFRENGLFALAILAILTLVVSIYFYNNFYHPDAPYSPVHAVNALFDPGFQAMACIFCIGTGFILALLQIFQERAFDLRAFLRHRAMTPTQVFLGKSAAGIAVYTLSIGVPILIFILWSATAQKAGLIFDIRFTRLYLLFFLNGLAFYFAGLLTAQRQVRWYVSRIFPIPAAAFGTACVFGPAFFWQALVGVAVVDLILGLAAWNSYVHAGIDISLGQPLIAAPRLSRDVAPGLLIRKLSLPAAMLIGLSMTACVLLGINATILEHVNADEMENPIPDTRLDEHFSYYVILPNGLPARVELNNHRTSDQRFTTTQKYVDLNGNVLPNAATQRDESLGQANIYLEPDMSRAALRDPDFRLPSNTLGLVAVEFDPTSASSPAGREQDPTVYYNKSRRIFETYDGRTGSRILTVGASGVSKETAEPFPSNAVWDPQPCLLLLGNRAVQYAPSEPSGIRTIYQVPTAETIQAVYEIPFSRPAKPANDALFLVVTDHALHFFGRMVGSEPLCSIPINHPLDQFTASIRIFPETPRISIRYTQYPTFPAIPDRGVIVPVDSYAETYTDTGKLVAANMLPKITDNTPPRQSPTSYLFWLGLTDSFRNPAAIVVFPWITFRIPGGFWNLPGPMFSMFGLSGPAIPYFTGLFIPMFLAAACAFWLTRRHRFTLAGQIFWTLLAFLCGPIGLLVLLFTQPLATRVPCPNCKKPRVVDQLLCEHCHSSLPSPPKSGTEIFA